MKEINTEKGSILHMRISREPFLKGQCDRYSQRARLDDYSRDWVDKPLVAEINLHKSLKQWTKGSRGP